MRISKQILLLCILVFASALPAVFYRELSPVSELNYIAAAQDAIDDGRFFSFFEDGAPFTQIPPLYMWLCMLAISIDDLPTSSVMLLTNVISLIGIIILLDAHFGTMLRSSYRHKAAILIVSMPFMMTAALLAQPIVFFSLLVVAASCFIKERTEQIIFQQSTNVETGNIAIPLFIFAAIFTNGFLGFAIPLFTLVLVLLTIKKLKYFFIILPYSYFLIILALVALWVGLTFIEAGYSYTYRLFITEPLVKLQGEAGSDHNFAFYFFAFWLLSFPLGISAAYAAFKLLLSEKRQIEPSPIFAIAMPIATLILISIPSSKDVTYVFASLPSLAYFLVYYHQKYGSRDKFLKFSFVLGIVPFGLLFFVYFFIRSKIPGLNSIYVISALLFLMLFSALAIFKVSRSSATDGMAAFGVGVLFMTFNAGFAMPEINNSVSYSLVGEALDRKMEKSQNFNLCYVGINNAWTLKLYNKDMRLQLSNPENIDLDSCRNNYRIIGRSALRENKDLNDLKQLKTAHMYGDTLLISPENQPEEKTTDE